MSGDESFTRLVDAHYAGLYRFALSLAGNGPDASDLTQQTFLLWATHGDALRDPGKAKSWLFTTLYREFLRGRRRDRRHEPINDDEEPGPDVSERDIEQIRRTDSATVLSALTTLDEAFRAPLTLFYLEDLSYQEIAAALMIPIGTVMSRLSRGKALLRDLLHNPAPAGRIIRFPQP